MMGLPSMNKRKLINEEEGPVSPPKQCRVDEQPWVADTPGSPAPAPNGQKSMRPSRLEELASVAPPDWATQRPPLLTTLLDDDDEFADEDFEEDEEEERYLPPGRSYSCRYSSSAEQCFEDQGYGGGGSSPARPRPAYWGYTPCPTQQTIRCEENGKSYLELGASPHRTPSASDKCCDAARTSWCRRAPDISCYRQRRLAVFNLSMCKLGRFRQFTDPSLLRSVLICNTLRYIEREMEQEGCFYNGPASCQAPPPAPPTDVNPTFPPPQFLQVPDLYESSGRATPYPMTSMLDTDSGVGDDSRDTRSINWGSVLSLSNQSALDPINNNELYAGAQDAGSEFDDLLPSWKLTPVSAEDVLKAAPDPPPDMELMQVLVSS